MNPLRENGVIRLRLSLPGKRTALVCMIAQSSCSIAIGRYLPEFHRILPLNKHSDARPSFHACLSRALHTHN